MNKTTRAKPRKRSIRRQITVSLRFILLDLPKTWNNQFGGKHCLACTTLGQIGEAILRADENSLWIAANSRTIDKLINALGKSWPTPSTRKGQLGNIIMLKPPRAKTLDILHGVFGTVIGESSALQTLPHDQLAEILSAPMEKARDLLIGGVVDTESKTLALIRGNLDRLVVPLHVFHPSGNCEPDFNQFKIVDYGQTIQFGNYEAAADFVLYQADPNYRKRINARRRNEEKGFGPSLRRLRHLKNLPRDAFKGVTEKTIARIERGEVGRPQGKTLRIISEMLNLTPDEIEAY